ncbi:MAG: glycine cleavage system protein GcvH [Gammaproteobacteria bacterium]|nr:glycine cleavage system protein GcvH [Gammaproteobacteria bacterium]
MIEARFTEEHAWVRIDEDGIAIIGISDHAQEQLGDIVFVQLPDLGRDLLQGEDCALIESVKTTSDVKCPLSGRVIEVNEMLLDEPDKLNEAALDEGWLFKVEPSDEAEYEDLMDAEDYEDFVDSLG